MESVLLCIVKFFELWKNYMKSLLCVSEVCSKERAECLDSAAHLSENNVHLYRVIKKSLCT